MSTRMKKKQRRAVGLWLREAADMLGLRDKTILVSHEPPDDDAWATCRPTWGQPEAVILVSSDVLDQSADDIARVLVHELLHIHHGDLKLNLHEAIDDLPEAQQKWIMQIVIHNVENMVDNLARAIVRHVNLPPADELKA